MTNEEIIKRFDHINRMTNIISNIHDDDSYYDWRAVTGAEDADKLTIQEIMEIIKSEKTFRACEKMFRKICKQRRIEIIREAVAAC